ncbi:hypothetical protein H8E52_02525 [bacterium]|nr:hypothetical protein [bacterium]
MGIKLYFAVLVLLSTSTILLADPCVAPDNGSNTVDLPPSSCAYYGPMVIVDGLPPGSTIEINAKFDDFQFHFDCGGGNGTLGGGRICVDVRLPLTMTGTGGYSSFFFETALYGFMEVHTAPRVPGTDSFDTALFHLESGHSGDYHFAHLDVAIGDGLGFPSPGHTDLTELPGGDFNVDSFFDITYRINFTGTPTGDLSGLSGSTVGTSRISLGEPYTAARESSWSFVKSSYR